MSGRTAAALVSNFRESERPMSSAVVQYPRIPQLSSADEIQVRRALRRNRLLATGLLALMITIAVATHLVPSQTWLVQLVRAGAEAGIVRRTCRLVCDHRPFPSPARNSNSAHSHFAKKQKSNWAITRFLRRT
jgi:hypothetical protein